MNEEQRLSTLDTTTNTEDIDTATDTQNKPNITTKTLKYVGLSYIFISLLLLR